MTTTEATERPDDEETTPERRFKAFEFGVRFFGGLSDEREIRSAFERETGEKAPQPVR